MSVIKHNLEDEMTKLIDEYLNIGATLAEVYSVLLGHQENIQFISKIQVKKD